MTTDETTNTAVEFLRASRIPPLDNQSFVQAPESGLARRTERRPSNHFVVCARRPSLYRNVARGVHRGETVVFRSCKRLDEACRSCCDTPNRPRTRGQNLNKTSENCWASEHYDFLKPLSIVRPC